MNINEQRELADQSDILKQLREKVNSSDHPALATQEKRDAVRSLFGFPKPVVPKELHLSAIPTSPIDAKGGLISYLERGYSVQPSSSPASEASSGRVYEAHHLPELRASTFNAGNIPLNAGLRISYNASLVLEFDNAAVLANFQANVDPLSDMPIIVSAVKRFALLKLPANYRILHKGSIHGNESIRAYDLTKSRRLTAPPGYDPAGGLTLLSFLNPAKTVPAPPSAKLKQWLMKSAVLEAMPDIRDTEQLRAQFSQVSVS